MEIWETIGLWHYAIPGCYLLAQFGLGVLIAVGNLVSNSVFTYLSDGAAQSTNDNDNSTVDGKESSSVVSYSYIYVINAWCCKRLVDRRIVSYHPVVEMSL